MPFDGLDFGGRQRNHLHDLLTELGITPVPDSVLEMHKASEIEKHPPSLLWNYPRLSAVISVLVNAMAIAMMMNSIVLWAETGVSSSPRVAIITTLLTAIIAAIGFRVNRGPKKPAFWDEQYSSWHSWKSIPKSIQTIISRIAQEDPNVRVVIGTLWQNRVDLDPYVLVERYNEHTNDHTRVCLGIWDGDTIIQTAHVV